MSKIMVNGVDISRKLPEPKPEDNGYVNLAIAIVETACNDYRILRRRMIREWDSRERSILKARLHEIELFLKSDFGEVICFGKGDYILKILEAGG